MIGSVVVLVSGCRTSAVSAKGSEPSAAATVSSSTPALTPTVTPTLPPTPTPTPDPTPTKKKYGFGLPSGPTAPGPELLVYAPLQQGDCAAAQTSLGAPDQSGNWSSLPDPAKVLLFQAGVEACTGDLTTAGSLLALDRTLFGATTTEDPQDADSACALYKALVSVLDQVDPASAQCPTGAEPAWQFDANSNPLDPRTHQDAYAHPATSSTPTPAPSASTASPTAHPSHILVHPSLILGHSLVTPSATS
ncbi:MAG TPA: hypothetical protein VGD55_06060 [Acidothermaceae bacterium]